MSVDGKSSLGFDRKVYAELMAAAYPKMDLVEDYTTIDLFITPELRDAGFDEDDVWWIVKRAVRWSHDAKLVARVRKTSLFKEE